MFALFLSSIATKLLYLALHLETGSFPRPLNAREEAEAFAAYRAGDAAARDKIIRHNLRLVAHIAKKYYAAPGEQEDFISIGTIGLIKAVESFDYTKKVRFSTYAVRCIENAILSRMRYGSKSIPSEQKRTKMAYFDAGIREYVYTLLHFGRLRKVCTKEIVDKLAALYKIPVDDLLDDYNRFLYKGQGKMIREYRESLGLQKKPFARLIGVDPNLLRAWEADQKRMNINSWEKYFKNLIKA